jgi:ABC-2 type transport system permease protein
MTATVRLAVIEWRLLRREPLVLLFGFAFPVALLVVMGLASNGPDSDLGGLSLIQTYVPILVAFNLTMLGISVLPTAMATYRERGVLKRLGTTPVPPWRLLAAQLGVNSVVAVVAVVIVLAVAALAFGVSLPGQALGFALAFVLTAAALFAIGLCIASVAPTARTANVIGTLTWFPLMFFAGLWIPRATMSDTLRSISDWTPVGAAVGALQDAMAGTFPDAKHLLVLLAYAIAASLLATRLFRWE